MILDNLLNDYVHKCVYIPHEILLRLAEGSSIVRKMRSTGHAVVLGIMLFDDVPLPDGWHTYDRKEVSDIHWGTSRRLQEEERPIDLLARCVWYLGSCR